MDYNVDEDGNYYEAEVAPHAPYARLGKYGFVAFCHKFALGQRHASDEADFAHFS